MEDLRARLIQLEIEKKSWIAFQQYFVSQLNKFFLSQQLDLNAFLEFYQHPMFVKNNLTLVKKRSKSQNQFDSISKTSTESPKMDKKVQQQIEKTKLANISTYIKQKDSKIQQKSQIKQEKPPDTWRNLYLLGQHEISVLRRELYNRQQCVEQFQTMKIGLDKASKDLKKQKLLVEKHKQLSILQDKEIEKVKSILTELLHEKKKIETQLNCEQTNKIEVEKYDKQISQKQQEIQSLEKKCKNIIDQQQNQIQELKIQYEDQLKIIKSELDDSRLQIKSISKDHQFLKENLNDHKEKIKTLNKQNEQFNQNLLEISQEKEKLLNQSQKVQIQNEQLQIQVNKIAKEKEEIFNENKILIQQIHEKEQFLNKKIEENQKLNQFIQVSSQQSEEKLADLRGHLEQKLLDMTRQFEQLNLQNQELQSQNNLLEQNILGLNNTHQKKLNLEIAAKHELEFVNEINSEKIQNLTSQLDELTSKIDTLQKKLDEKNNLIEELKLEIQRLKEKSIIADELIKQLKDDLQFVEVEFLEQSKTIMLSYQKSNDRQKLEQAWVSLQIKYEIEIEENEKKRRSIKNLSEQNLTLLDEQTKIVDELRQIQQILGNSDINQKSVALAIQEQIQQLQQTKNELENTKQTIEQYEQTKLLYEQQISKLQQSLEAINKEILAQQQQNNNLQQQVLDLTNRITNTIEEKLMLVAQANQSEMELKKSKILLANQDEKISNFKQQIDQLQEQLGHQSQIKEQLDQILKTYFTKFGNLKLKTDKIKIALDQFDEKLGGIIIQRRGSTLAQLSAVYQGQDDLIILLNEINKVIDQISEISRKISMSFDTKMQKESEKQRHLTQENIMLKSELKKLEEGKKDLLLSKEQLQQIQEEKDKLMLDNKNLNDLVQKGRSPKSPRSRKEDDRPQLKAITLSIPAKELANRKQSVQLTQGNQRIELENIKLKSELIEAQKLFSIQIDQNKGLFDKQVIFLNNRVVQLQEKISEKEKQISELEEEIEETTQDYEDRIDEMQKQLNLRDARLQDLMKVNMLTH